MDKQDIQLQALSNLIKFSQRLMAVPFDKDAKDEFERIVFNLNEITKLTEPTKNFKTDSKALLITIEDYLCEMEDIYPELFEN